MDRVSDPFGELLKAFRKRRSISQKDLAASLGIHYNTVSGWERGNYLPESKTLVLEIAYQLNLDEQETRQLLEASLTALVPHWSIPFPRNPFFTGRKEILQMLHTYLNINQTDAQAQSYALYGLGGIGKTQVALEYAYRHALEYSAVFWINAETPEQTFSSMRNIAELLNLQGQAEADPQRVVATVQRWLATHSKWLLIWDGLVDLEEVQRFLSPIRQGALLLTTRYQAFGSLARGLELRPMDQEEGILFLLQRAKLLESGLRESHLSHLSTAMSATYAAALKLVTIMGGLPLALDQAGAYLEETGCNLTDYLQLYEQRRAYLLNQRGILGGNHPQSVAATYMQAIKQMEQDYKAAADLLYVCAFLQVEAIPEELFVEGGAYLGHDLAEMVHDLAQFNQVIAILRSQSLVQRHAEAHMLSLHCLVRVILQEHMNDREHSEWARRVIKAIDIIFPEVTSKTWQRCERLVPLALRSLAALHGQDALPAMVNVARKVTDYLREQAQYEQMDLMYMPELYSKEPLFHQCGPDTTPALRDLPLLSQKARTR